MPVPYFSPVLNRRDTSVSIDYRTRNGDYAGVVIDQSCTEDASSRVRSSQRTALLHLCVVIFLRFARVQLPVDGYVRVLSSSLGFDRKRILHVIVDRNFMHWVLFFFIILLFFIILF